MKMEEWKEVTLKDITQLVIDYRGKTPLKLGGEWSDSGYRALSAKNVKTGIIVAEESIRYVDEDLYRKWMKDEVQRGDILITSEAPFGEVFFWNSDEKIVLSQRLFDVRIKDDVCAQYVYYYMTSYPFQAELRSRASGTTVLGLKQPELLKAKVVLPDYVTQLRIAAQLSEIDEKIAVNRRICENLEAQAQALFKHWFIDFAPFKNGKFVESELGMIPEGWRVGRLEEICSFISRGLSPKYHLGTNELVLGQTCVRNNIVTLNNAREHQPKENCNKYVKKWDVLLNSTGIGSLGRVGVVYFDKTNVCFDSHLTVVRAKEDIYRYYVGHNLLNRQKELENMAVGSTGQTELPKKDVLVMPILIPNSDVLPEFNDIIENIGNKIYTLIEENLRLSNLRDTLLPKLMSGQIKVNGINI